MKTVLSMIPAIFFILAGPAISAAGKIYTWIDEKGVTHITETPPPADVKLENVMEYQPQTPAREGEIQEKLESMRKQSEKERLLAVVEQAKRDADQALKRADEAQARVTKEQAELEEYKIKFANTTDRRRRFRFEIQRREKQVLDAKEAALVAARDARDADRRVAEAQARVDAFETIPPPDSGEKPSL